MKKLLFAAALIAGGAICLQGTSLGHGGTYRGPGDTVPAGGGGGTTGGPSTPGTGGPSTPGPSGPTTPGPASPGGPGGTPSGPAAPKTSGGGDQGPDLSIWQFWWGFNREPYLNLKAHIQAGAVLTGSDGFYLGRGEKEQSRDTLRPSEEVIRGKVVPALIQALKTERSNDILSGCMVALAKIGDPLQENGEGQSGMAKELAKFLADSNQEIAETAAVSLGILANDTPDNLELLEALLNNKSDALRAKGVEVRGEVPDRTRAFAAYGLGLIGHKSKSNDNRARIIGAVSKMLDGEARKLSTRDVAVACVTALGLVALPIDEAAMATPLDVSKGFPRPAAINTRLDQVAWLMSIFDDSTLNYLVRAHLPQSVARLMTGLPAADGGLREAVARNFLEKITKISKERNEVKQSCIIALGGIGDCDADKLDADIRSGLMAVKEELAADQMSRNFAVIALAHCAGRPGQGADPIAGLNDKRNSPRSFLLSELDRAKGTYKPWVALAIAVLERSLADAKQPTSLDAQTTLRAQLKDAKSPPEVGAMAIALGIMKDQGAKDVLSEKLDTVSDDEAKGYTAIGIGLINDRGAIEKIQAVIAKSKYRPDLLKSAAIGLGLLGDKSIVESLIAMLNEASSLSSQAAISSALGFIGDARSIDPLINMLQDKQKTDRARGFAAVALGIVADKEELPWNTKISVDINYRANTSTLTSPDQGTGILDIL